MTAILGLLDILRHTELNKSQQQYVFQIHSSTRSLLTVINDILDISKIEAGKVAIEKSEFSLLDVLESAVDLFAPSADLKGVAIHLSMDTKISTLVIGDRTRLTQVLSNILGNATKFTNEGEIVLSARVLYRDADSIQIQFMVTDTGIGIDEKAMDNLFVAFEQADTSTTRIFGGSGLGLAISFKLLELMDSRLHAESVHGKGSHFWFDMTFPTSEKSEHKLTSIEAIRKNILVIDDQPINCEILSEMLTHWGCHVYSAHSAVEAIAKIENDAKNGKKYDFLIVDWNMPEMNGFQFIGSVHNLYTTHKLDYEPPILMVTGAESR